MNGATVGDALSVLTDSELTELIDLASKWKLAHWNKDFPTADTLRQQLIEWGAWPPEQGWHPVFESSAHRYARALARAGNKTIN